MLVYSLAFQRVLLFGQKHETGRQERGSELIYFALLTTALSEGQLRFQVAEVENFSECTTAQSSSDDLGRQEIKSWCTARALLQHPLTGHRHF